MFNLNLGKIALLQLRYPNKTNTKKTNKRAQKRPQKTQKSEGREA